MKKSPFDLKNQPRREFERRHIEMRRKQNEKIKNPIEELINTGIEILTGGMLSFNPPQRNKLYYKSSDIPIQPTKPQVLNLLVKTTDKTKSENEGFMRLKLIKVLNSLFGIKPKKDDDNKGKGGAIVPVEPNTTPPKLKEGNAWPE
jgi:hypothetical protein